MKTLYKSYPTWWFLPSLDNFCETNMYITWKSDNYNWNEEIFANAEVFILWNPIEIDIWKYIPNEYFWRIKTMWLVKAYYDEEKKEFDYILDTMIKGEIKEDTEKRLKKALLNQHENYHFDKAKSWWTIPRDSLFIEVEKVNSWDKSILYKQKQLYNTTLAFDKEGNSIEVWNPKRYFKLTENIFYDTQKEVFIKNNQEIFFTEYSAENKKIFFKTILKNYPSKVNKETLVKAIYWKESIANNKKLLDLKASIVKFEFWEYLWLEKEFVNENILIAKRWQWYTLQGSFFDKIST